jgi:hypothetical protein
MNYGSSTIKGSHSPSNHGKSMNYGSSTIKGSHSPSSNHGRSMDYGSHHIKGSHHLSSKHGKSMNYGSHPIKGSHHLSSNHGKSMNYGSSIIKGSHPPSNHGKSMNYGRAFQPTIEPTESIPETFRAPPPTFMPTKPIIFNINMPTSNENEIPNIPLTFQIKQGIKGWASYSPPEIERKLITVISNIANLNSNDINNMKIITTNRRFLLYGTYKGIISYNITTIAKNSIDVTYNKVSTLLKASFINNEFNNRLHKLGLSMNTTFINISSYSLIAQSTITSNNMPNNNNSISSVLELYIGLSIFVCITIALFSIYVKYKTLTCKTTQPPPTVELQHNIPRNNSDIIPNPIHKRL